MKASFISPLELGVVKRQALSTPDVETKVTSTVTAHPFRYLAAERYKNANATRRISSMGDGEI